MVEQQTADLAILVDALGHTGTPPDSEALTKIAKALAKLFAVDQDEVAISVLNSKAKSLKFVLPEKSFRGWDDSAQQRHSPRGTNRSRPPPGNHKQFQHLAPCKRL